MKPQRDLDRVKPNGHYHDAIYLDNVIAKTKNKRALRRDASIKFFIAKHFLKISLIICLLIIGSHFIVEAYQSVKTKFEDYKIYLVESLTRTQIIKEYVKAENLPTLDLINVISREFKIKPIILRIVVILESFDDVNQQYRFEPAVYASRANIDRKYSEQERRMRASSHGITHIMGYRAEECGLHWSELYDKRKALMCTALIMNKNLENARGKTKSEKLYQAFKMYNGSDAYAVKAMSELGKILFNELI